MKKEALRLKRGGMDTIVAYIVVMLPLLYVVVYMVATIYHFSIQTYLNQVVKEAATMASTFGTLTQEHEDYIDSKLGEVLEIGEGKGWTVSYYLRKYNPSSGVVEDWGPNPEPLSLNQIKYEISKADIIGIYVESNYESILGSVTSFNVFGDSADSSALRYSAYREEIIRNENPTKVED